MVILPPRGRKQQYKPTQPRPKLHTHQASGSPEARLEVGSPVQVSVHQGNF